MSILVMVCLTALGMNRRVGSEGQGDRPQFDDVNITPANPGSRITSYNYRAGRFDAKNVSLETLIRHAYGMQESTIIGGPSWMNVDRFDLSARGDVGLSPALPVASAGEPSRLQLMVQRVLADRFRLVVHRERREVAGYRLVLLDRNGGDGPGLKRSELDCAALALEARQGRAVPQGGQRAPPQARCDLSRSGNSISIDGRPLTQFVATLSTVLGLPVADETGLAGNLDVHLTWTAGPDLGQAVATATRTQLGLDLLPGRIAIDVLVVDRAERPLR